MSLSNLTKEDCEEILNAFDVGIPPNVRYLPSIYAGRHELRKKLLFQLEKLSKKESHVEYAFINGERGQGKTMTSQTVIQRAIQHSGHNFIIPIYIDLGKTPDPLDIFRFLYLRMLTGAFSKLDFNDPLQDQLFLSMEAFAVDLNYHKVRPDNSSPPYKRLDELGFHLADLEAIVCIIIDEIDVIAKNHSIILDRCLEIFRMLNDVPRLSKFWIFCSTQSGESIFREASQNGIAFASRIYQAIQRVEKYKLFPLSKKETGELVNSVIRIFLTAFDKKGEYLLPTIPASLYKMATKFEMPREIIGHTTSMLYTYKEIEKFWKSGYSMSSTLSQGSSMEKGRKIDHIFKDKLLPLLNDIFPTLHFTSNPPNSPSISKLDKNEHSDGMITFNDDFKLFFEIKHSETDATLTKSYLNQLASQLRHFNDSKGVYLLFGSYDDDPILETDKLWLKDCGVLDDIKIFKIPKGKELEELKRLLLAVDIETRTERKKLIAACRWVLSFLNLLPYIAELQVKHKGEVEEPIIEAFKPVMAQSVSGSATEQNPPEVSQNTSSVEFKIKLADKLISGLGTGWIGKLKDEFNIETINDLIKYNADTIARIKRISPRMARGWIEEGKRILEKSRPLF